jgi:titin
VVSEIFKDHCTVAWQPPSDDGGAPITGFHLDRRAVTSKTWIRVNKEMIPEMSVQVGDLVETNEYVFRVAAENKAGIGEFSPPSEPFVAKDPWEVPGKPGRPTTSDVTGDSFLLTWAAPESDGGAEITNYIIEFKPKDSPTWKKYESTEPIPQTSHKISGLKEDTLYEFRVAAENKAGVGPFSDPSEPCKTLIGMMQLSLRKFPHDSS